MTNELKNRLVVQWLATSTIMQTTQVQFSSIVNLNPELWVKAPIHFLECRLYDIGTEGS